MLGKILKAYFQSETLVVPASGVETLAVCSSGEFPIYLFMFYLPYS